MRAKDFDCDKFILHDWPNALESGEFKQGQGRLYDKEENTYCCLGVACELLARLHLVPRTHWIEGVTLPPKAIELLGITDEGSFYETSEELETLASLNDRGEDFNAIADIIRKAHKNNSWCKDEPV